MGFDLFLAAVSIVAASIATWALLRLFPSSDARQAIPLRTDGGFADPSHTTDGGVTIDGKVTADGESASDIDGQPTDHLGKRLVIALILTIPTFVITLLALAKIAMPGWLTNPWPHAIVITPVMFYCAAPILLILLTVPIAPFLFLPSAARSSRVAGQACQPAKASRPRRRTRNTDRASRPGKSTTPRTAAGCTRKQSPCQAKPANRRSDAAAAMRAGRGGESAPRNRT